MSESEKLNLLRKPFPDNQISLLPKPYKKDAIKGNCNECGGYHGLPAAHLKYVGHAALTDRLLEVDINWNWEPLAFDEHGLPRFDKTGGLWIKLTICGQTRLGYGNAVGSEYKEIGAREKEVIGDALRNAAMRFGAALDLWHKGDLHIYDDENENTKQGATNERYNDASKKPVQQHTQSNGSSQGTQPNIKKENAATQTNNSGAVLNQGTSGQNNQALKLDELAEYKVKIKGKYLDQSLEEIGVTNLENYKGWWQKQILEKKPVGKEVSEFIELATMYIHTKKLKDTMKGTLA